MLGGHLDKLSVLVLDPLVQLLDRLLVADVEFTGLRKLYAMVKCRRVTFFEVFLYVDKLVELLSDVLVVLLDLYVAFLRVI